jgi:NAD(P)-dependent dehydrogenase (short-subunit alcohol dehydrogenase family)
MRTATSGVIPAGSFAGKTALVTGGGTGLGLEISTRLGTLGASVVCASRSPDHHAELLERSRREGFEALSMSLDVRDPKQVKRVVRSVAERQGSIDVLINNAAGNFVRPSLLLAPKAFATVIDIALNGVFYVSREVGIVMKETGGSIVNVSAPYATTGKPGVLHSACAKAGVEVMTKTLAAEWAELGIRVNAVSPGPFHSEGAADRLWPDTELEQAVLEQIPIGRFGYAHEVAELVCLLASDHLPWVTGSIWLADGGWSLPRPLVESRRKVQRRRRS